MNCDCDPNTTCQHTAQEDVDRALRLIRGAMRTSLPTEQAALGLACRTLERLDLAQRVLRGEYDAEVHERTNALDIEERNTYFVAQGA